MKNMMFALPFVALSIAGCSSMQSAPVVDQASLAESVRVPAGNAPALLLVGKGEITYECRAKADQPGQFSWAFVGPDAQLSEQSGKVVGRYYAGPTWESNDGSKVTGKQVATAPGGAGNIPLQLVKAESQPGMAMLNGVTYIQRLNTQMGVAPASPCETATAGQRQNVKYQADYVFYRAG